MPKGRLIPAKYPLPSSVMPLHPTVSPKLPISLAFKGIPNEGHMTLRASVQGVGDRISTVPARWAHALVQGFDNRLMTIPTY